MSTEASLPVMQESENVWNCSAPAALKHPKNWKLTCLRFSRTQQIFPCHFSDISGFFCAPHISHSPEDMDRVHTLVERVGWKKGGKYFAPETTLALPVSCCNGFGASGQPVQSFKSDEVVALSCQNDNSIVLKCVVLLRVYLFFFCGHQRVCLFNRNLDVSIYKFSYCNLRLTSQVHSWQDDKKTFHWTFAMLWWADTISSKTLKTQKSITKSSASLSSIFRLFESPIKS